MLAVTKRGGIKDKDSDDDLFGQEDYDENEYSADDEVASIVSSAPKK